MGWLRALTGVSIAGMAIPAGFPKRKPALIRIAGWLALICWVIAAACVYGFAVSSVQSQQPMAVGAALFGILGFCLFTIWAIPSAVLWTMRKKAEALLSIVGPISEAARGVGTQWPVGSGEPHVRDFAGMWLPTCSRCGQPALFHCRRDQVSLCWPCLQEHDTDQCVYVRATRVVPPEMQGRGQ